MREQSSEANVRGTVRCFQNAVPERAAPDLHVESFTVIISIVSMVLHRIKKAESCLPALFDLSMLECEENALNCYTEWEVMSDMALVTRVPA